VQIQLYGSDTLFSYAGIGFRENDVAMMDVISDGALDTNAGDYRANIQWGDVTSSAGGLVLLGQRCELGRVPNQGKPRLSESHH
jgi:hypothetical protein